MNDDRAIIVSGISKKYRIGGHAHHNTIRDQIDDFVHHPFGIGKKMATSEDFWALKDVSFDIKKGDVVGVIGRNGSGKSTLLKILSRIVEPTAGKVTMHGRAASLLEVGTGFNPDLTGRENIFLNGSILGMSQKEIASKYDEIVAFSGVEQFIDTPVKRYSSGMYVRLAFAVAAHLDSDILLVDEVLAVGDAEFQKKCLGKMRDLAGGGKTVLFVSHNMSAIKNLCNKAIYLHLGQCTYMGAVDRVIQRYSSQISDFSLEKVFKGDWPGNDFVKIHEIKINPNTKKTGGIIDVRVPLSITVVYELLAGKIEHHTSLHLKTLADEMVFDIPSKAIAATDGMYEMCLEIPGNFLNNGGYSFDFMFYNSDGLKCLYMIENAISFELADYRSFTGWVGAWPGIIRPTLLPFEVKKRD